ncbi:MAG: hypothetical protein ACI8TQ_003126 [Planctomycetota bacterium]|jgi:hypothetical protein
MRTSLTAPRPLLGILFVALIAASGCAIPIQKAQNETNRYPSFGLEKASPVDMAVLPIVDRTGGEVPVRIIRNQLYLGLADKLYSPISLNFVDVNWVEASHDATSLDADAVLRIVIEKWDTSLISTHGALAAEIAIEILDGAAPSGDPLWGVRIRRRLEIMKGNVTLSRAEIFDRAAELVAEEILALIPARNVAAQ